MTTHRYSLQDLMADYLRAGFGAAVVLMLIVVANIGLFVLLFLLLLLAIFLVYGARTLNRQLTIVEAAPEGIRAYGGLARQMRWQEIKRFDLRYFSTRRDRKGGWMQLRLDGAGAVLRVDSQISDFDALVGQIYTMIRANRAEMNEATMANLTAMGIADDGRNGATFAGAETE